MKLEVYERLSTINNDDVDARLVLDHVQRDKGRLRTLAADGSEVCLFLDRGKPLQVGEKLRSQCGKTLVIDGAIEPVITAICDDWHVFSRACYHLGNRHVKMQIGPRWLRITPDHVLEQLLKLLGLDTHREKAIFVPETGAYSHGHHQH